MNIITYPNNILRQYCSPVEDVTQELVATTEEMFGLMYKLGGIGLAAPQVGIAKAFFVMDTTMSDPANGFKGVLFNPKVIARGFQVQPHVEGCLSFPQIQQPTCRHSNIQVQYLGKNNELQMGNFTGISAICAQHEIDHLFGVLMIDYNQDKRSKK